MPFHLLGILYRTWNFGGLGEFTCKMIPYIQSVVVAVNNHILVYIALERYIALLHPHKAIKTQNVKHRVILISLTWLSASVLAIPNIIWYKLVSVNNVEVRLKYYKCY